MNTSRDNERIVTVEATRAELIVRYLKAGDWHTELLAFAGTDG
jgi:hypothetical protein